MERFVIRRSRVVIVICPHLEETVGASTAWCRPVLIENAPGSGDTPVAGSGGGSAELGLSTTTPMVLYTGTFEAYQGLDLLFAAAAHVVERGRMPASCSRAAAGSDRRGARAARAPRASATR